MLENHYTCHININHKYLKQTLDSQYFPLILLDNQNNIAIIIYNYLYIYNIYIYMYVDIPSSSEILITLPQPQHITYLY